MACPLAPIVKERSNVGRAKDKMAKVKIISIRVKPRSSAVDVWRSDGEWCSSFIFSSQSGLGCQDEVAVDFLSKKQSATLIRVGR